MSNGAVHTGAGGACFGDSGSPVFLEGSDPNLIVGAASKAVDLGCQSIGRYIRVDTPREGSWESSWRSHKQALALTAVTRFPAPGSSRRVSVDLRSSVPHQRGHGHQPMVRREVVCQRWHVGGQVGRSGCPDVQHR